MFEQAFKNIDDILHKDAGCSSELDYVEQTSWVLFLKYLDDLEQDKKTAAELAGRSYTDIIKPAFKWETWAVPKISVGAVREPPLLDHHKALTGDDLKEFVKLQKTKADSNNSWTIKIADVDTRTYNLSVKNPNKKDETILREPKVILEQMKALDKESAEIMKEIKGLV